jgi:hypothetical protein
MPGEVYICGSGVDMKVENEITCGARKKEKK